MSFNHLAAHDMQLVPLADLPVADFFMRLTREVVQGQVTDDLTTLDIMHVAG